MKIIFTLLLLNLYFCFGVFGQNQNGMPIKLLANEHTTTTIFFPTAISKTIPPSVNYTFDYRDDDPSIGLLKGEKGSPSNLTVITDDGNIYSFALNYSENIDSFNFMLTSHMAVGRVPGRQSRSVDNAVPNIVANSSSENINNNSGDDTVISREQTESLQVASDTDMETMVHNDEDGFDNQESLYVDEASHSAANGEAMNMSNGEGDLYDVDREEYYRIFCENNYLQKTLVRRTFRQNKRVVLKLNNILVDHDEIYFILQIENNSKKEYLVNGLSFFKKSGVGQLQKIMKPRYTYNLQDKIDPQSINEVVFVFKRFTISNKEEVYVVLDELENNRLVMLPLDNKQINAPTN